MFNHTVHVSQHNRPSLHLPVVARRCVYARMLSLQDRLFKPQRLQPPSNLSAALCFHSNRSSASEVDQEMKRTHPLKDRWTFWYLKHERTRHWETCLYKLATVSTLEQLISVMESIELPSHFVVGSDYYLFREGIKPSWVEECNTRGGRWSLPVTKRHRNLKLDTYWAELVSATVGEQFGEDSDQICGVAVSVRFRTDRLSVWTRDAFSRKGNETNQRIGETIMEKLRLGEKEVDSMDYGSHKKLRRKAADG